MSTTPPPPPIPPEESFDTSQHNNTYIPNNVKHDPAFLRIDMLLSDFIENSSMETSKQEQLDTIVSLYISYYETLMQKSLSKERNSQTFIRKISEAKTASNLKKEFGEEREMLIEKLTEAGRLIDKYVKKIKINKEKAKQKQGILKQFIVDKDAEIIEHKEKIIHLEALNDEYLIQYQGVTELSDSLQEQLTTSEQKLFDVQEQLSESEEKLKKLLSVQDQLATTEQRLKKLLSDNNNVESILDETNKNNAALMEQLLKENTQSHEIILQQHLKDSTDEKKILETSLLESIEEKKILKAKINSLQSELSNQYIDKLNNNNNNSSSNNKINNNDNNNNNNNNNNNEDDNNVKKQVNRNSNKEKIDEKPRGQSQSPKRGKRSLTRKKSKAEILKATKKVQFLESSIEKAVSNTKIINDNNGSSSYATNAVEKNSKHGGKKPSRFRKTRRSSSIKKVYETSSVVVATRIRPMNKMEVQHSAANSSDFEDKAVVSTSDGTNLILDVDWDFDESGKKQYKAGNNSNNDDNDRSSKEIRSFTFDATFGPDVGQEIVYLLTGKHVLDRFLNGYNGTIFAYGQTGSGKTYTMMGDPSNTNIGRGAESDGITPRLIRGIFDHLQQLEDNAAEHGEIQWTLCVTYIEIYMESIRDLLSKRNSIKNKSNNNNFKINKNRNNVVDIRERQDGSTALKGAMEINVRSYEHLMACINEGTRKRSTERTNANETSSRSHSVVTLKLTVIEGSENEGSLSSSRRSMNGSSSSSGTVVSKLHVVDLAGSENAEATEGVSQQRRQEGLHINKSLLALHRVIRTLTKEKESSNSAGTFIPYRASKLTRLLKDSLGGNCFTLMICNLSPSSMSFGETKRSIQFAQSVKNVKNKAVKNLDPRTGRIRQLEAENKKLRLLVAEYKRLMMETIVGEDDDDDGYEDDDRDDDSLLSESTSESTV